MSMLVYNEKKNINLRKGGGEVWFQTEYTEPYKNIFS